MLGSFYSLTPSHTTNHFLTSTHVKYQEGRSIVSLDFLDLVLGDPPKKLGVSFGGNTEEVVCGSSGVSSAKESKLSEFQDKEHVFLCSSKPLS